ncbi:sufE-like protein 2, chloroplastic [Argentina anserina]|uniref:sufE-like protein 2, chloroplastic n=1 Tax=Argentina anserina TaxID=57926 RepID=UPI00217674FB|nr:sufE-like protein 2, chloroplastic [Potentilla anserina]
MNSTTTQFALSPTLLPNFSPPSSFTHSLNPKTKPNLKSKPIKCVRNSGGAFSSNSPHCKPSTIQNPCAMTSSCFMEAPAPPCFTEPRPPPVVADKVKRLVLEFKALPEPIDRVKRLLHYAANLPPCSELARAPENRVPGCTTQVWLAAEVDELGRMRFCADSDSEISKGFCSCLIWMLDGAEPREVLEIRGKDLEDVNVGLYGKANSRVNTWHNVLLAMQRKTRDLVSAEE